MALTQSQIESIQVDYGIIYLDYGLATQELLGPTSGGGEVTIGKEMRDIEYDGARGKSKGMQVIDSTNASIKTAIKTTALDTLIKFMPHGSLSAGVISNAPIGVVDASKYLSNVTMFCKLISGGYKKITLNNVLNESDFVLSAAPKSEGTIELELHAHFDPQNDATALFSIEDVANIVGDTTAPTATTTPTDGATGVNVTANLTAVFSEPVRSGDINSSNVKLIKAADGSIVSGTLTYSTSTKTATFDPTASLSAATPYIWDISGVRDLNGNVITPVIVNFTTA